MRNAFLVIVLLVLIKSHVVPQSRSQGDSLSKPCGDEAYKAIQEFFGYDKSVALDSKIVDVQDKGTYKLEKFVFTNSKGNLVPGYLAIPKQGKASYPCMILLHAGAGSKNDWWSDEGLIRGLPFVTELLSLGYSVLALDAVAHGERAINSDYISMRKIWFEQKLVYEITNIFVQTTIDYRKAIDYLITRKEIDSTRIGIMGYSMGGAIATYLCTQNRHIKLAIICSTFLTVNEVSPSIYPIHFVPRIPDIPVLLLQGNKDEIFSLSQAKLFEQLLKSNYKKMILYDSGHYLPKQYLKDALEWIKGFL